MRLIPLTRGLSAKVSAEDYSRVSRWKWYAVHTGNIFYAVRTVYRSDGGRRQLYLHRYLLEEPKGLFVDHKNRDGLDCRRGNLRTCTQAQNQRNRRGAARGSKSGVRGVVQLAPNRWWALITVNQKSLSLGYYRTKEMAAKVRAAASVKYFGEFCGYP